MGLLLERSTWEEMACHSRSLLVLPLGATEQHGPHLPLDTDTRIVEALVKSLARHRSDLVIAPVLAYGSSGEHSDFAGTLSLGPSALESAIVEIVRSVSGQFRGVVVVSWHGGNAEPVARAVRDLLGEGHQVVAWLPRITDGDAHAGRTETSLMLAIDPASVRAERMAAGNSAPLAELMDSLRADGVLAHSPNGVLGDPRGASAWEGKELLCRLVNDLCEEIQNWQSGLQNG